ncbi:MAG: efflux RND transporter periplasmic adaptor subunit [Gemmatimonadaceae bacterium]
MSLGGQAILTRTANLVLLATCFNCARGDDPSESEKDAAAEDSLAMTPVHMAAVERGTINIIVSGPGRTDALDLQNMRAPFSGIVTVLRVTVGDRVGAGQVVAALVNQPSHAALVGAEAMVRSASTPSQRSDAERALELARQNLVVTQLRAPRPGVVVSRAASQGEMVSEGDSILTIASLGSIVFVARIAQGDLAQVRAGQRANINLPGQLGPVPGVVHGLLPADSASVMSVPVRIDFRTDIQTAGSPVQTGLFGTAAIVVGERLGVPIVPGPAVLRDDISGTTRIAVVAPDGVVHWVNVTTGATDNGKVEIKTPVLPAGQRVIVTGQVGLPERSRVREEAARSGKIQ